MKHIELYTHYVTPTFTKLNLLGLLHLVQQSKVAVLEGIKLARYGYAVNVLATSEDELRKDLAETIINVFKPVLRLEEVAETKTEKRKARGKREARHVAEIDGFSIDTQFLYSGGKETALFKSMKHTSEISEHEVEHIFKQVVHDKRTSRKGSSPSLLLAPDLGKFSSSSIPYGQSYPDIVDAKEGKDEWSVCTAVAMLGLGVGSFKLHITSDRGSTYFFAFPSINTNAGYSTTRILYGVGRRLSAMYRHIKDFRRDERFELSTAGILALISPIVKDVAVSSQVLSTVGLNLFDVELERKGGQYVRQVASVSATYATRLPNGLTSAMLAMLRSLRSLVVEVPEFFNALGEYLLSGDDTLYIEALRILASVTSDRQLSDTTKRVAKFLLSNAQR